MSANNNCSFFGRVTKEPELRYLPDGTAVANTTLCVDNTQKIDGQKVKTTLYLRLSFWGKSAESAAEWIKKGNPIAVVGELKFDPKTGGPRLFTRNDGTTGSSFEITVSSWGFTPTSKAEETGEVEEEEPEEETRVAQPKAAPKSTKKAQVLDEGEEI